MASRAIFAAAFPRSVERTVSGHKSYLGYSHFNLIVVSGRSLQPAIGHCGGNQAARHMVVNTMIIADFTGCSGDELKPYNQLTYTLK